PEGGGFAAVLELARTTGTLASVFDPGSLATTSAFTAAQAVARAAGSVGWTQEASALHQSPGRNGSTMVSRGTMAGDARAWLVYFPVAHGAARLAWAMELWGDPDAFLILIDAEDGTVLFRKNATNYQTQSATYHVYNDDSPAPMSPSTMLPGSGTQAPYILRSPLTLIGNEGPLSFNNLGWMTDGVNGGNGWTDGNNVQAGLDLVSPDGIEVVAAGALRVFNSTYDPAVDAPSTNNYRVGEVINQFYWTNKYHDQLYLLGFTEAAGNFQNDNFGRGGVAGDRVRAEAQDYSGTNNANFSTLPDGTSGRMQMYVFTGPTPDRTSGLDHDVLLHELTHGTSNRLHGNASGLLATMSGGMGEGWSDFYARAILSTAAEDVNGIYSMGGYVTNLMVAGFTDNYYYGIRRFPHAVKTNLGSNGKPHNPLTFADIDPAQINLTDGAYARGPIGSATAFQVHNIGEVWAAALFEVRARFINRLGWATGNQRILQFVTDGMKLDPWNPTLLQGRDSILAAANAGGGTAADIADIWAGFATRGMGASALIVNPNTGTVVEAFDLPGLVSGSSSLTAESIPNSRIDPTEVVSVSLCIVNNGPSTSGSVTGTLAASGGVSSPSGAQSYGTIGAGASECRTYSFTVSAACSATLTATLGITESGGPSKNLTYAFQVGSPVVILSQNFDGVGAPALPAGWTTSTLSGTANLWATSVTKPDTAPNRAFATDLGSASHSVLVSPSIAMPAGAATLTFRHAYEMEPGWDGGVLEISIAGGAFQDIVTAGGSFVSGGYNGTSTSGGAFTPTRSVWTSISGGYITTVVNLPAASQSQNIQLRWRIGSDAVYGTFGWSVDTVVVRLTAFDCGAPLPGAFSHTSPANGATGQSTSPTLSWSASSGAASYEYCIDTSNNSACNATWTSTGTNTTVGLSGLPAGTAHYWHVRAINPGGTTYAEGNSATFWSFTTQVAAPGAFSHTSPANSATGQSTSPTLSWGASTGAASYEYCIDTTNDSACTTWVSTGTNTSVGLSGLPAGTAHYWHVRAINPGGTTYAEGNSATFWSFTTQVAAPGAFSHTSPANSATGQSTSPTLSWGTSSGAASYEYCIDTSNNSACNATWTSTGTNTTVGLSGLPAGTAHYWHVRAINPGGTTYAEGNSATFWSFTTQVAAPGAFSHTSPANGATGQSTSPTLSWSASSGAASYEYCIDTSNNSACNATWTSTGTNTSVGLSGLPAGTAHYWHVRAINPGGTTYAEGNSATFWSFTTQVAAPGAFSHTSPANSATGQSTSPTLSWGTGAGAASYEYCIDTTDDSACTTWV
ncbi:MAG TPA: M36 family metallopeptidase, partial [Vicinamibacterales bacterium]|nr:M36 family metallopeptidase [Vicinamibacterales bacterium]